MGKTYRKFKGEIYTPSSKEQKKKPAKTKSFGFTDGTHSHHILFTDEAPIKGKHFIKYGYPQQNYPKNMVQAKRRGYEDTDED
jgi:hypothetical protein